MTIAPPYQPLEGCDIPALQPCVERWDMMRGWLPKKPGRMIDYGCHTGWFCRQFSKAGWKTTGFDRAEDWIGTAKALNSSLPRSTRYKPQYYAGDLLAMIIPECEVALCLSLAMYLFDDVSKGWRFFKNVSVQAAIMFIDFGGQYANRMPFDESTVIREMLAHTKFTGGLKLGETAFESRPFFVFTK